jgi:hypothetical protein
VAFVLVILAILESYEVDTTVLYNTSLFVFRGLQALATGSLQIAQSVSQHFMIPFTFQKKKPKIFAIALPNLQCY